MRGFFYFALVFCFCSGARAQTVAELPQIAGLSQTLPESSTGTPIPDRFCNSDPRTEVRSFCPWLSELLRNAQARSEADLRNTLDRLNPANPTASNILIPALSGRLALKSAQGNLLQAANQLRTDQQFGPGSTVAGTTSLVTKAGGAALLGLALDTGALTRTVNGTTATLSSNADELFRLLTGISPDCVINCAEGGFQGHVLNPLSLFGTFALAQSSGTNTPTAGQASGATATNVPSVTIPSGQGKLTSFTVKYQVLNNYDPRSPKFQENWNKQVETLAPLAILEQKDTLAVYNELIKDSNFVALLNNPDSHELYMAAKADATGGQLVNRFEEVWNKAMITVLNDSNLTTLVAAVSQDQTVFRQAWMNAIADVAGTMFSTQYTFNKPLNQPQTHDVTLIFGQNFGQYGSLTFNAAASLYSGALPVNANYGRVHYSQVSGEYDRDVSSLQSSYHFQINLAGYWQYQPKPSILNIPAGTVAPGTTIPIPNGTQEFVGTAGSLGVVQAGLTIKGPAGINIPLRVSWSNKTDLLQGSKVGAQIGMSYNFSSLGGLF